MIIRKSRIRKLRPNLGPVSEGTTIVPGVTIDKPKKQILDQIGLDVFEEGVAVLPNQNLGPIAEYNAEGKYEKHKDQPKETAYRVIEWSWTEYHGRDRVEQTDFREIPYERYPRTFHEPPGIELTLAKITDDEFTLITEPIEYTDENHERLIHAINLLLEIAGECEIFTEDLEQIIPATTKRVNWEILPSGEWPWEKLQEKLKPVIDQAKGGNQAFIAHRFKTINEYDPDFKAFGKGGFRGYVIFGFEDDDLYICESAYYGNATYVFNGDWEELSQRTKAEVIAGDLHDERIIHRKNWDQEIKKVLAQTK